MSNASVLSLNSVLHESPATLTSNYAQQTPAIICQGIRNKNVSNAHNASSISADYTIALYS